MRIKNRDLLVKILSAIAELPRGLLFEHTATGNPATFNTNVAKPMELTVEMNPVQDLHGQSNPYPPGGGKNLFDADNASGTWVNTSDQVITADSAKSNTISVESGTTLTISCDVSAGNGKVYMIAYLDSSDAVLSRNVTTSGNSLTATAGSGATKAIVGVYDIDVTTAKVQVEIGSSATSWVPFSNICPISGWDSVLIYDTDEYPSVGAEPVLTITIPDPPETVYGGTLTVNKDGTGTLVVDRIISTPTFTGNDWTKTGTSSYWRNYTNKVRGTNTAICTHFGTTTYSSSDRIQLNDTGFESKSGLIQYQTEQTALGNPIAIVYKLATPLTYHIDNAGLLLSKLGINNVWANTNETITIKYMKRG